ncbi:MAG: acyl-CoA carboxylase subunit beta [Anaerolineaceae bacterium]|nr:acyl-CoA carboxylase subunit beta [Anaerolineaceae bacterium]MBN2676508.1 acyl-CoA carboxylase subunit beta [Anaerolineaceae bacterium]
MPKEDPKIVELQKMREISYLGGGEDRIAKQKEKGKLTARERIGALLDKGSFQELNGMMLNRHTDFGLDKGKISGDGMIAGFGKINGRKVCVYAQDFTVMGGSFGEVAGQKVARLMDLAMDAGVPVIAINDGGGARIQEGVFSLFAFGEVFYRNVLASGVIPQICIIMGPCAGGAVYSPALTDFVVMTQGISNMFITGPEVIKAVTHEVVDAETLGGATTHSSISGVAHLVGQTEAETFAIVKKILEYIPDNNASTPTPIATNDSPFRADKALDSLVPSNPNQTYNILDAINRVVDKDSFFEIHARYATNAVVGFARLNGESIGIAANQPASMAGVLDINASDKIARFVRFCDAFNIPLVTFVDTPGFMPGSVTEHNGIIRHGAKIIFAFSEASVPKISVVTRKAYGGAYIVMGSKHLHADLAFAWPTAEIAVMGAEGAVNILYGRDLKQKPPEEAQKMRGELVEEYKTKFSNPYRAAAAGYVDEVILPSETRQRLISALEVLRNKQSLAPAKKHGNIPL